MQGKPEIHVLPTVTPRFVPVANDLSNYKLTMNITLTVFLKCFSLMAYMWHRVSSTKFFENASLLGPVEVLQR